MTKPPRRLSLLALLLAVVVVVPAAGAMSTAPPSPSTLLARHVPILILHPAERFRPVPVDGFLADADLQRKTLAGWEKVDEPLPPGGAQLRLDQRLCNAREGTAALECYADAQSAHPSSPTAYGAAFLTRTRIVLQYWLWYPFNAYSPTVPAGEIWQVHEGDWESVSVILDRAGKPLHVGLSSHCEGTRRDWKRAPKRGTRPLVYVTLGSHANAFRPGKHALDARCFTPEVISIIEAFGTEPVDHAAIGPTIRPRLVRVSATTPAWMAFAGTWGEDAFIHFPSNDPIVYGAGPRGPAFHKQWRRPVGDVLSWPRA